MTARRRALGALDVSSRLEAPAPAGPLELVPGSDAAARLGELAAREDAQALQVVVWERTQAPQARSVLDGHAGRFAELRYLWLASWSCPDDELALQAARRLGRPLALSTASGESVDRVSTTVLLATYEQPTTVLLALEAIAREEPGARVVVCDDGSRPRLLDAVVDRTRALRTDIRYVWQEDRGFRVAASRNNGLSVAPAADVLLLDGDMVPAPGLLRGHRRAHDELGDRTSVVVGNRLTAGEDEFRDVVGAPDAPTLLARCSTRSVPDEDARMRVRDMERCSHHPWRIGFTCNLSVRGQVGFLDEAMRSRFGGEDLEWCYRLWRDGASFAVAMEAEAVHLGLKESYRRNMEVGTHEELVLHAETLLFMISRHSDEPFMRGMLDAFKYYSLGGDDRWSIGDEVKTHFDGAADYLDWRSSHEAEVQELSRWRGRVDGLASS